MIRVVLSFDRLFSWADVDAGFSDQQYLLTVFKLVRDNLDRPSMWYNKENLV